MLPIASTKNFTRKNIYVARTCRTYVKHMKTEGEPLW